MNTKFTNNILVLDDDPFMLKLVAHMLENLGCTTVATCDNGRAALEMVDSPNKRPDLIILDLNMPDMDGLVFVRHLVEHRYAGSLILMSGEDEPLLQAGEKLVRAHKIPMLGSFRKPVTVEVLISLLEKFPLTLQNAVRAGHSADELRAAIANGELINYYQPKVSLTSGSVVGVETLMRWRIPLNGLVSPYKFLGIAESSGLIHELTRAVFGKALAQAKHWLDGGLSLRIAVNISIQDLDLLDFADSLGALASAAGVAPQNIELEVEESWLPMQDSPTFLETLTRLHMKHFRLSIDEFGTGYSSIAQLHGMPFDELKIDRSFVTRISNDAKVKAKYDTLLAMARKMNLKVAAVGVEDLAGWNTMGLSGCDYAQGSFIADPMPAEELPGWIKAWKIRIREERLVAEKNLCA